MLHILCSSVSYISFILENLPNGTEKNSPATTEIANSSGEQPGEQIVYNKNILFLFIAILLDNLRTLFFGAAECAIKQKI